MVPSSFMISQITAAGSAPARRARSQPALGVAGAREHAALLRHQREHVPGRDDVGRFGAGLDRDADGSRAVGGGDAGGDALGGFDRNRERGAEPAMHVAAHQRQRKLLAALLRQRQADKAAAEARHEVDVRGSSMRGGHQQVAFVLAVFVVHQDDHASPVDFVDDLGDRTDRHETATVATGIRGLLWPNFALNALPAGLDETVAREQFGRDAVGGRLLALQQALKIARQQVHLDVHRVPGASSPRVVSSKRVRHDVDLELGVVGNLLRALLSAVVRRAPSSSLKSDLCPPGTE